MNKKITDFFSTKNKGIKLEKIQPIDVYTLMFDGGSRGNPGTGGAGYVIYKNNTEVYCGCSALGHVTNNFAEYKALELGLDCAIKNEIDCLVIKGDSMLVLNQVSGKWKVKSPMLIPLCKQIKSQLGKISTYSLQHVKRKYNKRADQLANMAMDGDIITC